MIEPITDDALGQLEWDPLLECWLGGIDWPPGLHTEVAVWPPGDDLEAALRRAREDLDWLQRHEEQARSSVARAMLMVYNDAWRGGDPPLSAEQMACQVELTRIGFQADGSLLLSYGARELFGGHMIDAEFGVDRSLGQANLVG